MMHLWGDSKVDWNGLNEAPYYIGEWLIRWARMNVTCMKEKWGTVRVYCNFGWDSFYTIWRPHYMWVPKWWPYKLDLAVCKVIMPIINRFVIPLQKKVYAWRYKKAIEKWPHLKEEIIIGADWGKLFEGVIPGYKHSDYWTEVKNEE